ncbi:hypothetical protein BKA69DRAFT_1125702 [Paraphysoderma sedebokerense]|nr:hypothetical protein BKA69DRAFT_1125702 [Paraphysoderma sedebokerense]
MSSRNHTHFSSSPPPSSPSSDSQSFSLHESHLSYDKSSVFSSNSNLDELLKCFICLSPLKRAVMCPECSKMGCEMCLVKWLTEQKRECPHCRAQLLISQLVHCRFIDELQQQLKKVALRDVMDSKDMCKSHKQKIFYYCTTCSEPHKNHSFQHLQAIYNDHAKLIMTHVSKLKRTLKMSNERIQAIEKNIIAVNDAKKQCDIELKAALERAQKKIDAQLRRKLMRLLGKKTSFSNFTSSLDSVSRKLQSSLQSLSQVELIYNSDTLTKLAIEYEKVPDAANAGCEGDEERTEVEFESEVVPSFEGTTVKIVNFSAFEQQGSVFYSEPFIASGNTWRLKVYPAGNGQARGNYLSIFVELVEGSPGPIEYQYRIQLINQTNKTASPSYRLDDLDVQLESRDSRGKGPGHEHRDHNVTREFSSEFEVGECWGYNKFFPSELLKKDGFLDISDTLVIKYYVRALSYHQKCSDLSRYVVGLQESLSKKDAEIKDLKSKLQERNERSEKSNEKTHGLDTLSASAVMHEDFDKTRANSIHTKRRKIRGWRSYDELQLDSSWTADRNGAKTTQITAQQSHIFSTSTLSSSYPDNSNQITSTDNSQSDHSPSLPLLHTTDKVLSSSSSSDTKLPLPHAECTTAKRGSASDIDSEIRLISIQEHVDGDAGDDGLGTPQMVELNPWVTGQVSHGQLVASEIQQEEAMLLSELNHPHISIRTDTRQSTNCQSRSDTTDVDDRSLDDSVQSKLIALQEEMEEMEEVEVSLEVDAIDDSVGTSNFKTDEVEHVDSHRECTDGNEEFDISSSSVHRDGTLTEDYEQNDGTADCEKSQNREDSIGDEEEEEESDTHFDLLTQDFEEMTIVRHGTFEDDRSDDACESEEDDEEDSTLKPPHSHLGLDSLINATSTLSNHSSGTAVTVSFELDASEER